MELLPLLFFAWYEALSLPLRFAVAACPASGDVRRVLSRLVGPALLTIPVWFAAHWCSFATGRALGLALWLGTLTFALVRARRRGVSYARLFGYDEPRYGPRLARRIAPDLVSFLLYAGFLTFRRWVPEMTCEIGASAAEKFMNMMLFWTNYQAASLPAPDLWLAGHTVNYYDWGHFHWAWVSRLLAVAPPVAINLALARVTVQVWEGAYLLARAVRLTCPWALLAGTMATWGGPIFAARSAWTLYFSTANTGFDWSSYDFWAPSRVLANTIDEFPAFTAILGDFHAHHLVLGWFLAAVALMAGGRFWCGSGSGAALWARRWWILSGAACASLAVQGNLWNMPLVGWACALWASVVIHRSRQQLPTMISVALLFGLLTAGALIVQWSHNTFALEQTEAKSFAERIPVKLVPADLRSKPSELLGFWGIPALLVLLGTGKQVFVSDHWTTRGWVLAGLLALGLGTVPATRGIPGGSAWIWFGFGLVLAAGVRPPRSWLSRSLLWVALGTTVVLAGLELVYVQDRFRGELFRYNCYFKLSYPLWPLLWVAATAAVRSLFRKSQPASPAGAIYVIGLRGAALVLLGVASAYTTFAFPARLLQAAREDLTERQPSLDAVEFVEHRPAYAADWPMLAWIRQHVPAGDVVAEGAMTGAYHFGGRVASLCGRPTLLGWEHHEQQWRGPSAFTPIERRKQDINGLYKSPTAAAMVQAAAGLGVRWVLYGINEAQLYGPAALALLREAAPVAFSYDLPSRDITPSQPVYLFDFRRATEGVKPQ